MKKRKIARKAAQWEAIFEERLPLFGHRNWIVVADSAYPAHANPGIETIVADADHLQVTRTVLKKIAAKAHIRANIYTDLELQFVTEKDAPGVIKLRSGLEALLGASQAKPLPHEEIMARLDKTGELFRVLIIKTDLTIPYTSVFLELDCGYWSAEAEQRMRKSMKA